MKKIYLILFLFIATIFLDNYYGPFLYAKISGQYQEYTIGKLCDISRIECENMYFKNYLNKIASLSKEDRLYFSDIIIKNDRIGYSGNCPCPYNEDSRGYSCGRRSSYSKSGQISYCYDKDVSDTQIITLKKFMVTEARRNLDDVVQKNLNIYHEYYTLILIIIFYCSLLFYYKKKLS